MSRVAYGEHPPVLQLTQCPPKRVAQFRHKLVLVMATVASASKRRIVYMRGSVLNMVIIDIFLLDDDIWLVCY